MHNGIDTFDGTEVYRIADADAMNPFSMTVVSPDDLWMFLSSTGGLTAGRVDRDTCLFPYETDDRLHRTAGQTGPVTVLQIDDGTRSEVWEPFGTDPTGRRRSLLKSVAGDAVVIESEHERSGLVARGRWAPAGRLGWVRTVWLDATGVASTVSVHVLDGVLDVMPWGISAQLQQRMSNLANAYRRSDLVDARVGVYTLEAAISDHPEPAESLRATTVWSTGLDDASVTLSGGDVASARAARPTGAPTHRVTGRPGAYLLTAVIDLEPGTMERWHVVADVAQRHAQVASTRQLAGSPDAAAVVDRELERSRRRLHDIIATADGVQRTSSAVADAHHQANTLFNVMRGGVFLDDHRVDTAHFAEFVAARNARVADRNSEWLAGLADVVAIDELRAAADTATDADLVRLVAEYLPLSFSRRHGDPSRPWNMFEIRIVDDDGRPERRYQGNWRDIFQNWEALGRSFPRFLPSMIAKFLNASTIDGFNPYRITSDGIDWEIIDPDDPWSGIGYWGDHQIVYLTRLLETQHDHDPDWLPAALGERVHSFADVPYRLVRYDQIVADPKSTIRFDDEAAARSSARVEAIGSDGKLIADADGNVVHVSMLEKLLIPVLSKLSNLVPRGGIWMNTERPEWNDANNALVGAGLSMVTLAQLYAHLRFLRPHVAALAVSPQMSPQTIAWTTGVTDALARLAAEPIGSAIDPARRSDLMRDLGASFEKYRHAAYTSGPSDPVDVDPAVVQRLVDVAIDVLGDSMAHTRRADGLLESYNLLRFDDEGAAHVDHLPLMLEGQVALIASGVLDAADVVTVVERLGDSELYRPDVDTFMLYPAHVPSPFVERNRIPDTAIVANPLLSALVERGDRTLTEVDTDGEHHFHPDFRHAGDVHAALDGLASGELGPLVAAHGADVVELFDDVFEHHRFTGRSSTMHGFEGIGSVYWHMVAKLLVAVHDQRVAARRAGRDDDADRLDVAYERVRRGLGVNRTPEQYGAFPTDPYSHTPAGGGASQPGMTGQVKEELVARWAELGIVIADGCVVVDPDLIRDPGDLGGVSLTLCGVPFEITPHDSDEMIEVTDSDGGARRVDGLRLDRSTSAALFARDGSIQAVTVRFAVR